MHLVIAAFSNAVKLLDRSPEVLRAAPYNSSLNGKQVECPVVLSSATVVFCVSRLEQ